MQTYIAIDIGASSGRLMKSQLIDGKLKLEELHRFQNKFQFVDGHERWQMAHLIHELAVGLQKAKQQGIAECFVGIDTWGVDYCLLDASGQRLADPIAYRDARTADAVAQFETQLPLEKLYALTGIQIQPFNTLFQLLKEDKTQLKKAQQLLLMPDYLGYVFTGNAVMEKTNASTTQLFDAQTQTLAPELLALLGIEETLFPPLVEAGTVLGTLQKSAFSAYDLPDATFITVASHDTASAVVGVPALTEDWAFLSSGTWSLLGVEMHRTKTTADAFMQNYTNEWGAYQTIRFLKNIMGMWLIQEVARMQQYQFSYAALTTLAEAVPFGQYWIDVNDSRFLHPKQMIEEIQQYCQLTNQPMPKTPAQLARCVYDSLAACYAQAFDQLKAMVAPEKTLRWLHIVGGGANNQLLNQLTANLIQCPVIAGPFEATAIGNVVTQMLTVGELPSLINAREIIAASFEITTYQPQSMNVRETASYQTFIKE